MHSFYTSLDHLELLEISGEDSGKFLQGQLTCDINNLPPGSILPGAACNNKGRVYSNFRLININNNYFLSMQPGMLTITRTTLQKFIPFYKATSTNVSKQYRRYGFAGEDAEAVLKDVFQNMPEANKLTAREGTVLINLGGETPRFELWIETGKSPEQIQSCITLFESFNQGDQTAWELVDQHNGIVLIHPQESSLYTPEELNLDLAGFISFDKGCYTGQEIVARMHYRGKASKRMYAVQLESTLQPDVSRLNNESGEPLGSVFNLLYSKDNIYSGLTVIKTDSRVENCYCLDPEGKKIPATVKPLNYPAPGTAEK